VSFLPFRQGGIDPFEQFIHTINLSTTLPWKSCPQKHYNRSPGTRGVWLARVLSQLLRENGISPKSIGNSSQIILNEERQRRWNDPSFWGYSRKLTKKVTRHFEANNARFAQAAWSCNWDDAFSTSNPATQRRRTAYAPPSIEAEVRMHAAAQRLLDRIKRQQTTRHPSPLKRLIRLMLRR